MSSGFAIVLVDDEKMVLDALKGQLRQSFGRRFTYETAENVDEAWEVIDELHDDGSRVVVVVSDWLMPGVRGDRFLRELAERCPRVVRIMLTGQADGDAIDRVVRDAIAYRVLRKPWRLEELTETIEGALAG